SAVSIQVLQGEREIASGNKVLGRFDLVGIQPAPRGTPHIEVSFDFDANGIVNVSARDKATGKEQSIQITSSSGLSMEDIDRLVKDAQLHKAEDRKKKELVDSRNMADVLIHTTEKTMAQMGEKIDPGVRMEIENAVSNLKQALKTEDTHRIQQITETLTQAAHKMAEQMYRQPGGNNDQNPTSSANGDEDIVDAEFEEVA
ncbi:MAG: Hsp70 family protein, partial [Desulfobacula sp.]|nr:Hsp70 family protein [Desulfobacula sp.]